MPKIDCLKIAKGTELEKSLSGITENMPESKQRELGLKAALSYHKQIHNELQDFKKSIATDPKKYRKEKYVAPDFAEQIKTIKEKYNNRVNRVIEPLPGAPVIKGATGADVNLVSAAEGYAAENNIPLSRQSEYVEVDVELAKRIADAYEKMENNPDNPAVKEAYENLIKQTRAQYDTLVENGYEFTFFDSESDPYEGNPYNAMRDLRNNKKMAVYGTYDGYGTEGITAKELSGSPMLADTGLKWKDQKGVEHIVTANDLFRAVHDAFGHGLEGSGFRARGEENAWQAHSRLFTGSAIGAMTSETRGQNSWLNYGKFGEKNRTAKVEDTVFAEQKIGLMPEWTWQEGRAGDMGNDTDTKNSAKEQLPKKATPIQKQGSVEINTTTASTVVSQEGDSDLKRKIISDAKKVLVALKGIAPDMKVVIFDNDVDMRAAIGGVDRGAFDPATNTIYINLESVQRAMDSSKRNKSNTLLHEGVHPILNIISANNDDIINKLNSQILKLSEKVNGVKSIIAYGDSQAVRFNSEKIGKMETVVEFISQVANGDIDIKGIKDASVLARLSKILNDFLKMLGVNKPVSINKASDIIKLSRQISDAFDSSATIGVMKVSGNETPSSKMSLQKQGEARTDFKRTENYKSIEQKPLSFFKDETITITGADWLAAGDLMMPDGSPVNLKGGWAYPAETGNVWATAGKQSAGKIINRMNESIRDTGVAHLGIRAMTEESAISNYSTFIVAANYLQSALINKDITKKELVERVQSAYKNNKLSGKKSSISLATKSDKIVEALLYDFSVSAATFEDRKAFLFSVLGGVGLKSKSVWGNLPTSGELLKKVTDPSLVGIRNQSLVAIIRVDSPLTYRQTTAEQDGRIYHDAYPVVVESSSAPKVFLLDGAYNIEDAVPNFIDNATKEEVSLGDYEGKPTFGSTSYTNKLAGGAAQVVRNVKASDTAKPAIQFQGEGDLVEQSGKRKEMTEDDNGNYLFFHYSNKKFDKLNPEKVGSHLATSRSEKTSISTSSLYTRPDILEANVPNNFGYIARVPKDNVYPFATDPLNLLPEAEAQFRNKNRGRAFDANNQVASVAKLAAGKGFPVTVADWNIKGKKTLIAKTTEALSLEPYINIKPGTTNQIQYAKGTENIKPNAKRRDIQYQGEDSSVGGDVEVSSWNKLQKENPDLFKTGVLRKSLSPFGATSEIPEDVHSKQMNWQNYGQNDVIEAENIYGKPDSYGYYNDKDGNPISEIKTGDYLKDEFDYDNNGEIIKATISNEQLKNNLIESFDTKNGKEYLSKVIDAIPKNTDGTITAYRIGNIGEGAQSYTVSEGMAKTFSNQGTDIMPSGIPSLPREGYKEFGVLSVNVVKIDPKGILAWSPYDSELLVKQKFVTKAEQPIPTKEGVLTGGAAFSDFFAKITNTKDGGAKFDDVKQVLNKGIEGFENELAAYLKYGKNFQKHIMASIPAFVDARIRALKGMAEVAAMLGKGGKEVNMLDITSSEGYFTKAWAQLSQDKGVNAKADALDAGVTFQRDFNEAPQVPGVNYLLQAWGDSFVDPNSGVTIPSFKATKKYGVVFEGMGFQFFTSTRDKEIQEVKSMMDKDGLFVTMEKLKNSDYEKREVLKDEFKSQFFTQKEMAEKAATVLKKSDEVSVGMMDYQFDRLEYEKVLAKNFKHVVQFYSAGNFAGYYASDNLDIINTALKNTGDTTTKFNEEVTPRVISKGEDTVQLQQGNTRFKTITSEAYKGLVGRLKKAFPNTSVQFFNEGNVGQVLGDTEGATEMKGRNGTVYGFVKDGKVYLNENKINANTPVHEFGHIWQRMLPNTFKQGIELLKSSKAGQALIETVKNNSAYASKTQAQIEAEALVVAIGDKGESIFNNNPSALAKFTQWVNDFFNRLGSKMGIKSLTPDYKFDKFVRDAVGDILGGKEIVQEATSTTESTRTAVQNTTENALENLAKENGISKAAIVKDFYRWVQGKVVKFTDLVKQYAKIAVASIALTTASFVSNNNATHGTVKSGTEGQNIKTIKNLFDNYYAENNEKVDQAVLDRAIHLWKMYGSPTVNIAVIGESSGETIRANYIRGDNSMNEVVTMEDFIAELAHAMQYTSGVELDRRDYATQAQKDSIEYDREGSVEYDAHKVVQPILATFIFSGKTGSELIDGSFFAQSKMVEGNKILKKYKLNNDLSLLNDTVDFQYEPSELPDAISEFKKEGLSDSEIRDLLKMVGNADAEIDAALIQPAPADSVQVVSGITHVITGETREEYGLPEYQRETQSFEEWDKEAKVRIENNEMGKLLDKLRDGGTPTAVEQRMMGQYVAELDAIASRTGKDEDIKKLHDAIELSDRIGGSEVARGLVARKGLFQTDNTLGGYWMEQMEASQVDALTEEQKQQNKKEFDEISAAKEKLEARVAELEKVNAELLAKKNLNTKPKDKTAKKTDADFKVEREKVFQHISDKLREIRNTPSVVAIPYARELFAVAPDVAKLVRSFAEQGIVKLEDVVKEMHTVLKSYIPEITKRDVIDLIAGEYNTPKITRNEIAIKLRNLRIEAKLSQKLTDILESADPASAGVRVLRNKEISELRKELNIEKSEGQSEVDKLKSLTKRNNAEYAILKAKLDAGDYTTEQPKTPLLQDQELKQNFPAEYKEALAAKDKLVKLKSEREIRLLREEQKNRSKMSKFSDGFASVLNLPRSIMSSIDFSAPLRQGVIPTISHPIIAAKAFAEMFAASISQKRFDRFFNDLRESDAFVAMQKSGLYVADPTNPKLSVKEEAFMSNLAEKIPLIGKLIKGSERAYVSYLNKMRVDLFKQGADILLSKGKTIENALGAYKVLASFVNNSTGRGSMTETLEKSAPILNSLFFSPRLIAARLNFLNPVYYVKTFTKDPQVGRMLLGDMAKFVAFTMSVLALAKMGCKDDEECGVETDARSTDFGKIKVKDTRYDIWGGFQQYIRFFTQMYTGQSKSIDGEIRNISGDDNVEGTKSFGSTRMTVLMRFARGKLSPVPATLVDIMNKRTVMGEKIKMEFSNPFATNENLSDKEIDLTDKAKSILLPLIVTDVKDAVKEQGIKALGTVWLPATFGIGVQTFKQK